MKTGIKAIAVLLFFCTTSFLWAAAKDSGCITCHTNETIMKSLFKAPADGGGSEGEG